MAMTKIAVVTGSSSGIGKAISDLLLEMGYKVYGVSLDSRPSDNPNFLSIKADLTDAGSYSLISQAIKEEKIDLLVNNAGVAFEKGALDFSEDSFGRMSDVNFKAPILLTKEFKNKLTGGLVINISSVSDRLVGENYALYCSSKAALNRYFDVVALEEKSIKFASILPSYVDTPLLRKLQENNRDFAWEATMKPEQIAELVGKVVKDGKDISSGAKIIAVSDALKEDLEYKENLLGYNVTTQKLFTL